MKDLPCKKWFDEDCETLCKDFPWCTDDRLDPKVVQERIKLYKEKGIGPFFGRVDDADGEDEDTAIFKDTAVEDIDCDEE